MPTRDRPIDRAARTVHADLLRIGSELRIARVAAGLSQCRIGERVGLSASQISRVERGLAPRSSLTHLVQIGAVVGLDVRIRAYPAGDAVRDAGHLRVIERLRQRLHPRISVRLEVPLPIAGDRRAWDAWLGGLIDVAGRRNDLPAEVETRIVDAQAQLRRLTVKMRDSGVETVLLVIADTPANRRAVAAAWTSISAMFPVSARAAMAALADGRYPAGSCLVFI